MEAQNNMEEGDIIIRRKLMVAPENILFVIDVHEEMNSIFDFTSLRSRLEVVKDLILTIVRRKSNNNLMRHRFAIATFSTNRRFHLLQDYTSNVSTFYSSLQSLNTSSSSSSSTFENESSSFDLNELLMSITSCCSPLPPETKLPSSSSSSSSSAVSLYRAVLIYGRSFEIPILTLTAPIPPQVSSPSFIMDILYFHAKRDEEGVQLQAIFNSLIEFHRFIDEKAEKNEFIFEMVFNAMKLLSYAAALMTHPIQRADSQTEFLEKLNVPLDLLSTAMSK